MTVNLKYALWPEPPAATVVPSLCQTAVPLARRQGPRTVAARTQIAELSSSSRSRGWNGANLEALDFKLGSGVKFAPFGQKLNLGWSNAGKTQQILYYKVTACNTEQKMQCSCKPSGDISADASF